MRAYVEKVTGMRVSQTTRLIRTFLDHGVARAARYRTAPIQLAVHRRGHCTASGSGPDTRVIGRSGDAPDLTARVRAKTRLLRHCKAQSPVPPPSR